MGATYTQDPLLNCGGLGEEKELPPCSNNKAGFLRFDPGGVRLLPDPQFLAKNQSASFTPGEIFVPTMSSGSSISEDRKCCPVRALKWYLDRTKPVRKADRLDPSHQRQGVLSPDGLSTL